MRAALCAVSRAGGSYCIAVAFAAVHAAVAARKAERADKAHKLSVFFRGEEAINEVARLRDHEWSEARARMARWEAVRRSRESEGATQAMERRPEPWTNQFWQHTWNLIHTELMQRTNSHEEMMAMITGTFSELKEKGPLGKMMDWSSFVYQTYGWTSSAYTVYANAAMAKTVLSCMVSAAWVIGVL